MLRDRLAGGMCHIIMQSPETFNHFNPACKYLCNFTKIYTIFTLFEIVYDFSSMLPTSISVGSLTVTNRLPQLEMHDNSGRLDNDFMDLVIETTV